MSTTVYGAWVGKASTSATAEKRRAYLTYTVTDSATSVSVAMRGGYKSNRGNQSYSATFSATGKNTITGGGVTYTFSKTTSAYNVTISATISYYGQSSVASATITIPALQSWTIAYNSNGGSGTVNSQTKYYGINLTLASDGFTRVNHSLTGWNTKSDGSGTSYSLGGTYSENDRATLYAQWYLDYWKPTVASSDAYRVDSVSDQDVSNDGNYIRVKFTYTGGTSDEGASYIQPTCVIKIDGTQVYSGTLSATGSFNNAYGTYTENTSHTVSVLLYDSHDTSGTSFSMIVSAAIFPIDILGDGSAMGIMTPAVAGQTLKIFVDAIYPVGSYYETSDVDFDPNAYFGGTWTLEAEGLVHIGAGSTYTVGNTGGKEKVRLSAAIGAGNNNGNTIGYITEGANAYQQHHAAGYVVSGTSIGYSNWNHSTPVTEYGLNERDTSIMQPYVVVNRWHRTA